uniref:Protein TIC 214 n=1 Tax=Campanula rapunculoides TaxID=209536 RepID=A0A2K9RM22_9ASTR|nr:Ycf1 [Campanula rapunculoides]
MSFQPLFTVFLKILNSAAFVGLACGLITVFSIRPSYFFLLVEEPEKKVAAITGLILGQLVRFLSIYNAPLHRLLCIPHAITAFFLPYLFFSFLFDNFHPSFSISTSSTFSIFLNSFIFQLSNQIILPSSLSARLGHIYLFRCKNKLDFLTGSFVGWSIGQICLILFLQRIFAWLYKYRLRSAQNQLVSKWNKSITKYLGEAFTAFLAQRASEFLKYWNKSSTTIYQYLAKHVGDDFTLLVRDCEWFVSEVQYLVLIELPRNTGRVITIFLYITSVVYATRMPIPMVTYKLKSTVERTLQPFHLARQIEESYAFSGLVNNPMTENKIKQREFKKELKKLAPNPLSLWGVYPDVDLNEVVERRFTDPDESVYRDVDPNELKVEEVEVEEVKVEGEFTEPDKSVSRDGDLNEVKVEGEFTEPDKSVSRDVGLNKVNVEDKFTESDDSFEATALSFFEPNRWDRPLRYIRNKLFVAAVQEGTSQYFFDTCRSDGKERIAFTYLPALSFFKEMMKRIGISSSTVERPSFDELDKNWLNNNKEKKKNLNNELKKRMEALDTGFLFRDILDKRTRVCTDKTIKICLPTKYDPFLNGPHRGRIKEVKSSLHLHTPEVATTQISTSPIPIEKKSPIPIEKSSIPIQTSESLQIGETIAVIPGESSVTEMNPVLNFLESCFESLENVLKKRNQPRRRKKIVRRLYGKYLKYQARRRKTNQTFKSQARRRKKRPIFKSRGRKNGETSQSREREIIQPYVPRVIKFVEINRMIDTLLPGFLPHSPKYELRTFGLLERQKRLAKSKIFSNPLAKLFQRVATSKFFSNPLAKLFHGKRDGRVDWNEQEEIEKELRNYGLLQKLYLDHKISKKVPRWRFLLISELQKEVGFGSVTAPKRRNAKKENDYEILSYKIKELSLSEKKKKKKKKRKKRKGTQKDQKTEKTENEIDQKTQKTENEIDQKTQKTENEIDQKTQKKDKTEKTDEDIEKDILNDDPFHHYTKKEKKECIKYEFSNWDNYRPGLIKGSMRAQRRKRIALRWVEPFFHSPLFYHFTISRLDIYFKFSQVKALVQKLIDTLKIKISKKGPLAKTKRKRDEKERKERKKGEKGKERKIDEKERKERKEEERLKRSISSLGIKALKLLTFPMGRNKRNKRKQADEELSDAAKEYKQWAVIDEWENTVDNGLGIRSYFLFLQRTLRKYVRLPLLIILKNMFRFLFLQKTEWFADFEDWQSEVHIVTDNNGNAFSGATPWMDWPEDWFEDGFQIKVLHPFSLKAWHTPYDAEKVSKKEYLYLMPLGWGLASFPFGDAVEERSLERFLAPILNELKPIGEIFWIFLRSSLRYFLVLRKCIKVLIKWIQVLIKWIQVLRKWIKVLIKWIQVLRKRAIKNIKRLIKKIQVSKKMVRVDESSETQKEKDSRISNEIIQESFSQIQSTALPNFEEQIENMIDRTNTINKQIEIIRKEKIKVTSGLNKEESPKNLWKIFKRRKVRLINKFHYLQKCLIEKIDQICLDLVLSFIKKFGYKDIDNAETNKKRLRLDKDFWKSFDSPDLSSLSQAYVFYKLSQSQVSDKLRSVLQYRGTSFFLKTAIKESFERQGIFHSELKNKTELKNKKLRNFRTSPWKNWLRGHSHYTLSKRRWSNLKAQLKWSNLKAECQWYKKKAQLKWSKFKAHFNYFNRHRPKKKEQNRPKKKEQNVDSLKKQKNKLEKNYRYDLLAYKFISSETKKDSYISKQKDELCAIPEGMFFKYYLNSQPERGFPGCIFGVDLVAAIDSFVENKTNEICMEPYPSLQERCLIPIQEPPTNEKRDKNSFLNWMGMNEDLDLPRVNSSDEDWFVGQVMEPSDRYSNRPWISPSELLLKNLTLSTHLMSAEELKEFKKEKKEKEKKKKELKEFKKEKKEKEKKEFKKEKKEQKILFLRADLENQSEEQEGDIQEAFTNAYEKMLRQRKEELLSERTGRKNEFLVYWHQVNMHRCQFYKRRRLATVFRESNIKKRKRKILFNFWKAHILTTDNTAFPYPNTVRRHRWLQKGAMVFKPYAHPFIKNREQLIMYQAIRISLDHKMKLETKENLDLLVPEMIFSSRRRRELRILNSLNFNFKNRNGVDNNRVLSKENNIKSRGQFLDESKDLDREKNEFIKLKFFLWPNFRLEDLACMNRYWFDTSNGSRFSMLRLYLYPRFKIR